MSDIAADIFGEEGARQIANPRATIQEALREYVGDGEGLDEAVLGRLEHDIRIKTLRNAAIVLEGQGVEPWNRNLQAIKTLRSLADFLDKRFGSGSE